MVNITEYKELLCASLFHDIGKLAYRSKIGKEKHEQLSEYFYNQYISPIPAFKSLSNVHSLILSHHADKDTRNAILSEADQLSAGERQATAETFTFSPLKSIFSTISIQGISLPEGFYYYDPYVISHSSLYPKFVNSENTLICKEDEFASKFKKVYDSLCQDFIQLKDITNYNCAINSSLTILEKHLSLIPSASYKSIPDVSLYDHSRMTAAIASCLYLSDDYNQPFLFIEGDISGIQNYIYNIKNAEGVELKMAKRLRGRSFEIVLVTDAIVTYILEESQLTRVHLIYSGGGNFILMIPANKETKEKILSLNEKINSFLFKRYQGGIGLVLVSQVFSKESINDYNYIVKTLKDKVAETKHKKYNVLFSKKFFGPYDFSEDTSDICAICGRDFKKGSTNVCEYCQQQVTIGELVTSRNRNEDVIARLVTSNDNKINEAHLSFEELGIHYYFIKNYDFHINNNNSIKKVELLLVNHINIDQSKKIIVNKNIDVSYSFFFAGIHVPLNNDNEIMTFEDLSKRRKDACNLIGVLRSDVDDLGYIFSSGLGNRSISRFATLSRNINMFFQWIINYIAHEHAIYITYSGGDDLFVVGNWKDIIEFSIDMRNKFKEFVCNNESFGISAGIGVFSHNYPIRFAAKVSGELENRSKVLVSNDIQSKGKNAITIFDTTVSWAKFIEFKDLAYRLYDMLEENKESSIKNPKAKIKVSLLYRIYSLTRKVVLKYAKDRSAYVLGEWIPNIRYIIKYILSRRGINNALLSQTHDDQDMYKKAEIIQELINDSTLLNFAIPASIVIYSIRNKEE